MELIVIAIATYKRPIMLTSALKSLLEVKTPTGFIAEVMICDNDPEKSAYAVYESAKKTCTIPLKYFSEGERGTVPARNRLLEEVQHAEASYVAFFDDDETVHSDWLVELVNAAKKFDAEAVWGRTIYTLPDNHPDWLGFRNFFGGDQPKTGTLRRGASTNNVLVDVRFLREHQLRFDSRFNDIGGSDSFLFREVRDNGGKVIASQEAITYEEVPASRATEEWILRRAYKNGHTEYRRVLIRKGKIFALGLVILYGSVLLFSFIGALFAYPMRTYDFKVFNRRRKSKIKGLIDALMGKSHEEYSVVHGK